jgi:hypothetical protein
VLLLLLLLLLLLGGQLALRLDRRLGQHDSS